MASDLTKVELHCELNNAAHNTNEISTKRLIVRRGQPFLLTCHASHMFNLTPDALEFTVQTGPEPSEALGTKSVFGISHNHPTKKSWDAKVEETSQTSVTLAITSPADASIGEYTLSVKTNSYMKEGLSVGSFIVLFNPWCVDDWVHLPNEHERQEYVLNEQGILYMGTNGYIDSLAWDFGQFEDDIIDICLKILDVNPKCMRNAAEDFSARCNSIYVSRVVSAMINSADDRGVLEGRWGSNFYGGVSPLHWNGSVDILRQWRNRSCQPVKYGQCWVFAAVMCTVLRCLGIPCRVVTNFESAHDTDGNLTIDDYFADYGVKPKESHDSVWNFHVWVEGWMRRPDLSKESVYDGWQVLDPTPQELSDGVHCCGPAPVKALLMGHTDLKYDMPFIFAEVNGDRITWLVGADGSKKKILSDTVSVGQNISTKGVGNDDRSNITSNYKHPEGTGKERQIFKEAVSRGNKLREKKPDPALPAPDISFKIEEQSKPIKGKDIDLTLVLHSDHPRSCNFLIHINAQAMLYTGSVDSNIWSEEKQVQLLPNKELKIPFQIPFSKYSDHVQGNNSIKVTAVATDEENSDAVYLAERNIVPENPPFKITVTGSAVYCREMMAEIIFENPLSVTLNDCSMSLTGSGLLTRTVESSFNSLGPGLRVRMHIPFIPYKVGQRLLVADFDCDLFRDIKSSCHVDVKYY
ncbi:hypothetical protein AAFF_G00391720 [Aldrovandia affinis]|uniref:Protein-glutamine gamma-glutamyltransferase 2 n=1 Tax=Aldrovandia affinis TaxID=143900 RepID=A0AAD7SEE3_9TELE|nr:hypothetical protein AAFF_G00391720 [Aldrovandia affinis]